MEKVSRKFIADSLKKAGFGYFLRYGFSCFEELGVCSWGKYRADILAVNLKSVVVIAEIKSSVQDFMTDTKWKNYLSACNRMYFIFTEDVWFKLRDKVKDTLLEEGVGVLVLCPKEGWLKVRLPCRHRPMTGAAKKMIVTRMAWRAGDSKRTHRRQRVFLTERDQDAYRQEKEETAKAKSKRTRKPSRRTRRGRTT